MRKNEQPHLPHLPTEQPHLEQVTGAVAKQCEAVTKSSALCGFDANGTTGKTSTKQPHQPQMLTTSEVIMLTGLTRGAIRDAAKRNHIEVHTVIATEGRRKGNPINHYPAESVFARWPRARAAFEARERARADAQSVQAEEEAARQAQAERQRGSPAKTDRGLVRAWHVRRLAAFLKDWPHSKLDGIAHYIVGLKEGRIDAPDWARTPLSARTLQRWEERFNTGGAAALDPKYKGNTNGHFSRHPEQAQWLESMLLQVPHIKVARLHEGLKAEFKAQAPAANAVYRWVDKYKTENALEFLQATNPDKAKSKYQAAFGSYSANVASLNQLWEADATKVDLMFLGDGKRYTLCGVIDVYSGRVMFSVAETASGRAHGLLFRKAIMEWGLPETIKTDNGKDYTSQYLSRFFADFGIEQVLCAPFAAEQKPHIERAFGTFQHDLVEIIPGYTGHSVAEAQDLRARKTFAQRLKEGKEGEAIETGMSKEAFEAFMAEWCLADAHRVRKSGRLKGRSPAQIVDDYAAANTVRRVKNPEMLDYLLSVPHTKTIGKQGIKHSHRCYIAPELGGIVGRQVEIRVSPDAPGRVAVFYDGAFVCMAVCPELEGIDQAEVAARARERQKAADRATRAAQKEIKKLTKPAAVVSSILDDRLSGAGRVSQMQVPDYIETQSTEAAMLAQAAEALATKAREMEAEPPAHIELDLSEAQLAAVNARLDRDKPAESSLNRYARLLGRQQLGLDITPDDAEFMAHFETTAKGRRMRLIHSGGPIAQYA